MLFSVSKLAVLVLQSLALVLVLVQLIAELCQMGLLLLEDSKDFVSLLGGLDVGVELLPEMLVLFVEALALGLQLVVFVVDGL